MTIPLAALLPLFGGAVWAQPNPVIQAETRVVLVDAVVTGKKGEYLRDLQAKEIRIWEDNKEQTVKSFSFDPASADPQPAYLVLFFDNASISAESEIEAQQAASGFIDANVSSNRKMAVVSYNGTLRIAQNFTDSAGRLKDALKGMRSASESSAAPGLGARDMLNSLGALARNLKDFPGRKILVLLSGGLPPTADQKAAVANVVDASNKAGVAIYAIDVQPVSVQLGKSTASDAPAALDPSNLQGRQGRGSMRGDAGDEPVAAPGPKGSAPPPLTNQGAANQQILAALSSETGGFAVLNSDALLAALQRIGEEQNQYYVLTYTPPESKEGSCHTIRVKVDRGGAEVRARTGYCTGKPQDLLAGTVIGKNLETRAAAAQTGGIQASMQLPYFYIAPTVARVHLAMEISPEALKFENQKGKLHAEINLLGIASSADRGVAARFSDSLKFDFDNQAQADKLKQQPLHYEKEFKIVPGHYNFTMAFSFAGASESLGKLEMPLAVDSRKPGELALSGLMLSKEAHPVAELATGMDTSLMEDRTPLVTQGMQLIPSGTSVFRRTEPVFFYFETYDGTPDTGTAQLRMIDRNTGGAIWDSGSQKFSGPQQGGRLPVDSLAPGLYRLELRVSGAGGKSMLRAADFEIR